MITEVQVDAIVKRGNRMELPQFSIDDNTMNIQEPTKREGRTPFFGFGFCGRRASNLSEYPSKNSENHWWEQQGCKKRCSPRREST